MSSALSISLLGSVYFKESASSLRECLTSIKKSELAKKSEMILVQDGPIGEELRQVISEFRSELNIIDVILEKNVGLGPALNAGLKHCSGDLIARFDTDDVYPEYRLEIQREEFYRDEDLILCGGWIAEFETDPKCVHAERRTPTDHSEILCSSRKRNPFNHMTVMFKRHSVLEVGGYGTEHLFEDYALWVKLIGAGGKVRNLPCVLAYARTGLAMYERRGGLRYAISETSFYYTLYRRGFISLTRLLMNGCMRLPVRLAPSAVRSYLYRRSLRSIH